MASSVSSVVGRSPITIAAGFVGAFIVGSMAVQLVRTQASSVTTTADVEPVIASPAVLWSALGDRDAGVAPSAAVQAITPAQIVPVVASEATLWSAFAER